jgi:hypothetical protein
MTLDQTKELQRLLAALDSLYSAGFSAEQVEKTAQRIGVSWKPGLL